MDAVMSVFSVTNDNMPNIKFNAKLDYFSPNIDMSTGTVNIRGKIDNKNGRLRDGMYVKVNLPYEKLDSALLVNDASIGSNQLGYYLYLISDSNTIYTQKVDLGELVNDTLRQIINGVTSKDKYVVNALLQVRDGMKVAPYTK